MRDDATVYLMYHELELPGRPLCQPEPGYVRYVVQEANFCEQMEWLQSVGRRGISVSQALEGKVSGGVAITFDDGCETDLTVAAPILREANFGATFYITVEFLGRPGYMTRSQVRELSDAEFEIGCHSMTHPYLTDLDDAGLHREIVESKEQLEEITGRPVHHFSCPGGRWSSRVAEFARRAGYRSVATSRIGTNGPAADAFQLARIAVMRGLSIRGFADLCSGRGLWQKQLRDSLQNKAHQLLGNTAYDRLRSLLLGRGV
jgi:peptidoglycan/xylan/chitin deacetylase (PgdA/CDA1 family)